MTPRPPREAGIVSSDMPRADTRPASDDQPQSPPPPAARLVGLGGWLPPRRVSNDEVCARVDSTDAWIRTRIGITTRRIADPATATSDMAVHAGRQALESAGIGTVDAVLVATSSPDHLTPATAAIVAHRLDQPRVPAFDIAAACSGFLYACTTAAGLIAAGSARTVLVVGAEKLSAFTDLTDRSTAPIFGDGAGAVVLTAGHASRPGTLGPVVWGSDGAHADALTVPDGGSRRPPSADGPTDPFIRMRGNEVLRHAVRRMSHAAREAATAAGWTLADVDRLVLHQANAGIATAVATQLGIPPDRVPSNIARVANTSAASIPLLLAESAATGTLRPGHRTLLTAFGAGFTWAACTVTWPNHLKARLVD